MSKKLKLNPKVSYVLGLFAYNKGAAIGVVTTSSETVERFVSTAVSDFGIEPNKILVRQEDNEIEVHFYNSKLKKLMLQALERKERIFKYRNDYSANYLAGIFDMKGGKDAKGLYIRDLEGTDEMLLEKLGFHTLRQGGKSYVLNENTFVTFIKEASVKALKVARMPFSQKRPPSGVPANV